MFENIITWIVIVLLVGALSLTIKKASEPVKENSFFVSYMGCTDTTCPQIVYGSTVLNMRLVTNSDLDSITARIKRTNGFRRVVPLSITPLP